MQAKRRFPFLTIFSVILFSLICSVTNAQQIYHGDGAANNGSGAWSATGATSGQCLKCHSSATFSGYLASGHKNMLRKVTPGAPWLNADGSALPTTDDFYGSGSIYDWNAGTVTVDGDSAKVRNLFYIFGAWTDPAQLNTIFDGGFTGEQHPTGNYSCALCHSTGYRFDALGPEPTTYNGIAITDAQFSRIPADQTSGTSSWNLTGVQCERCHNADNGTDNHTAAGVINAGIPSMPTKQNGTALCMECHRQETDGVNGGNSPALPVDNQITLSTTLGVLDGGSCADGTSPDIPSCTAAGAKWAYAPFFDSDKGQTFLNSPHARFTGSLTQTAQNTPDRSIIVAGVYNSAFTDTGTPAGNNSGCTGCHDPHQSTVTSAKPLVKTCVDCHDPSHFGTQTVRHPSGPGTPFPTGTSADNEKSCAVCHMASGPAGAGYHLFRISVDPNYSTFPTGAQLLAGQNTPNTAADGAFANAVWTDVDLACGQCHVGSGSIGITAPAPGAPILSKSYLAATAVNMHLLSVAAAPSFSPNPYTYNTPQAVTLTDASSGVPMYFTIDGSAPTTASTLYAGPIAVTSTTTIKAIAAGAGYRASPVATATFKITAAAPSFSPNPYTYNAMQSVTLADASAGVPIYYTTDGTTPTAASALYASPIAVATTTTIKAIALGAGYGTSAVTTGTFKITAAAPSFSPIPYTYKTSQSVTLADATSGVSIYYTTNGTTPTTLSTLYSAPITVSATTSIKTIAVGGGYGTSTVATGTYVIKP